MREGGKYNEVLLFLPIFQLYATNFSRTLIMRVTFTFIFPFRNSIKAHESHEYLELPYVLKLDPNIDPQGRSDEFLSSSIYAHLSSENNSLKIAGNGGMDESYHLLPFDAERNVSNGNKRSLKKRQDKKKNGHKSVRNSFKEDKLIENTPRGCEEKSDNLRKRSLPPNRELSFQLRPRSKSFHLHQYYKQDQLTNDEQQHHSQQIQKQRQEGIQIPAFSRPDSRINKSILDTTHPFQDTAGPVLDLVTKNLKSGDEMRGCVDSATENLIERLRPSNREGLIPSSPEGSDSKEVRGASYRANDSGCISCKDLEEGSSSEYDTDCEPDGKVTTEQDIVFR